MVRDMEDSARQARTEVAQCMAEEQRLGAAGGELEGEIGDWQTRAETAVRAGDDALAKEALRRKGEKEAERAETKKARRSRGSTPTSSTAALKALDARLKDVKLRQGTLRAKATANRERQPAVRARPRRSTTSIGCRAASTRSRPRRAWTTSSAGRTRRQHRRRSGSSTRWPATAPIDDALAELKRKLGK